METKDIIEGFTFSLFGNKVIVITDYEKVDKNKKIVQIAKVENPKVSAGQFSKEEIIHYLKNSHQITI